MSRARVLPGVFSQSCLMIVVLFLYRVGGVESDVHQVREEETRNEHRIVECNSEGGVVRHGKKKELGS